MASKVIWTINGKDFSLKRTVIHGDGKMEDKEFDSVNAAEFITSMENIANGLFGAINDFEASASDLLGLDKNKATLGDIYKILKNYVNQAYIYTDIDKDKIIRDITQETNLNEGKDV